MSVHLTKDGTYSVRWREGSKHRRETVPVKGKRGKEIAKARDAEIKLGQRYGTRFASRQGPTLAEFISEDFGPRHAEHTSANTKRLWRWLIKARIKPGLGDYKLAHITPRLVEAWRDDMLRDGVGRVTVKRAMGLLSIIFNKAVLWEQVQANPVQVVPPPRRVGGKARKRAFSVAQVEAVRAGMVHPTDALIVSLLAYAGLRPQEALALMVSDIGERTLLIERAWDDEGIKDTKTGSSRSVRLFDPLSDELREYVEANSHLGYALGYGPLFPYTRTKYHPTQDWTKRWESWRRATYYPAAKAAELPDRAPYSLRHTFASLLIRSGVPLAEVAEQMGHASQTTTLQHYAHLIEEYRGAEPLNVQSEIQRVRAA